MSDDFFERLRNDAAPLRYEPDSFAVARIHARIHARIAPQPTVAQLLARWFRPLAAAVTAVAIVAGVGLMTVDTSDPGTYQQPLEITMAGDTYRVGE